MLLKVNLENSNGFSRDPSATSCQRSSPPQSIDSNTSQKTLEERFFNLNNLIPFDTNNDLEMRICVWLEEKQIKVVDPNDRVDEYFENQRKSCFQMVRPRKTSSLVDLTKNFFPKQELNNNNNNEYQDSDVCSTQKTMTVLGTQKSGILSQSNVCDYFGDSEDSDQPKISSTSQPILRQKVQQSQSENKCQDYEHNNNNQQIDFPTIQDSESQLITTSPKKKQSPILQIKLDCQNRRRSSSIQLQKQKDSKFTKNFGKSSMIQKRLSLIEKRKSAKLSELKQQITTTQNIQNN